MNMKDYKEFLLLFLLFLSTINNVLSLIAYDCGGEKTNLTTVSTVDIPECLTENIINSREEVQVRVLQVVNKDSIKYSRCRLIAHHVVMKCGFFQDTMQNKGVYSEVIEISRGECSEIIKSHKYKYGGITIENIFNGHTSISATTFGNIVNGVCTSGGLLIHAGQNWENAVRTTEFEFVVGVGTTLVDFESNQILLPDSVKCNYVDLGCFHFTLGNVFWELLVPTCGDTPNQSIIFQGLGSLITRTYRNDTRVFIQVHDRGYDFQLMLKGTKTLNCGYKTYGTEHPKLFVSYLPIGNGNFPNVEEVKGEQVDLMLYFNSKLVYAIRHTHNEIERMFEFIQNERCILQNRIIGNMLTTARSNPIEFSYQYFGGPGYTAVLRGEVIHISKCLPVPVFPIVTTKCYNELPVSYNNKTRFMTPRNRLLVDVGAIVDCSPGLEPMFKFGKDWYTPGPSGLIKSNPPKVIRIDPTDFKFEELSDLSNGGIYTLDALRRMTSTLLSPISESIMQSRIVTSLTKGEYLPDGYSFVKTFTPEDIMTIKNKMSDWILMAINTILDLGGMISSIFGIYMLLRLALDIVYSFFNFRALNNEFGIKIALKYFWWHSMSHHVREELRRRREADSEMEEFSRSLRRSSDEA